MIASSVDFIDDSVFIGEKVCEKCKENKPRIEFYKHNTNGDGLQKKCKKCFLAINRELYSNHKTKDTSHLNRVEKFVQGYTPLSELSYAEVTGNYILNDDGSKVTVIELRQAFQPKFTKEVGRRIQDFIRSRGLRAVEVIFEIADSDLVEPADRLKASQWIAERLIGKTPEKLEMTIEVKPYEAIFQTVDGGSREDYRNAAIEQHVVLEAEVIEDQEQVNVEQNGHEPISTVEVESDVEKLSSNNNGVQQSYEKSVLDIAESLEDRRNEAIELKKRLATAKKKRFAARYVGASSLEAVPWMINWRVTGDGMIAVLVPPDKLTESMLEKIQLNDKNTNDPAQNAIAIARIIRLKANKLKAKLGELNG